VHQRVPGADRGTNLRHQQPAFARHLQNLAKRDFEVLLNIVAQRLQRRNIEDFGSVLKIARQRLAYQAINAGEKCGKSFAGAGGRRNQCGVARQNMRPSLLLRLGGCAEALDKPSLYFNPGSSCFAKCSLAGE
jgi:hypothetical protein